MDYDALLKKYQALLIENQQLQAQINAYRHRFGLPEQNVKKDNLPLPHNFYRTHSPSSQLVHNGSSPKAKIKLFMSRFQGRRDVYAKRWQSRTGKSGYSPVCLNEWDLRLCRKPRIKCCDCPNQNYAAWNSDAIERHLRGHHVLGLYPLMIDETCALLAIDFDGPGWQKDVTALRTTCAQNNIPVAVERSQSGEGAHLWFFFEQRISSSVARKFGSALLTHAMASRHAIRFSSYDRLFPSQDTLPKGGFGNLIALPLQKLAREKNNSVFIDENFHAYDDQWRFLTEIRTLSENDIHTYTSELCSGSELGKLRDNCQENESVLPWENKRQHRPLMPADLPNCVRVIKANMLYIDKNGLSEKVLNFVKRLAAFKNPAFYKAQAMRLSTWNKPRIISLTEESDEYLHLPRGCEDALHDLFAPFSIEIKGRDERTAGHAIAVAFNGQLHKKQADAVQALLKHENGVLSATTAFGKTVVAAKLIAERKVNTLVLVHTRQLVEQWRERLAEFLIFGQQTAEELCNRRKKSIIGQIGGGKNSPGGIVDIAVMQSLVRGDQVKNCVRDYGMVVADECHHIPAFSFERILKAVMAKYVYGLTATPTRADGHHPIIFMQCGPVRYRVDAREQAQNRPFHHVLIPRFTSFKLPSAQLEKTASIASLYARIVDSPIRNQLIVDDVLRSVKAGRNPLILTQRTTHVTHLAEKLRDSLPYVISLTGSLSAKERKAAMEAMANGPPEDSLVIVATGRLVGEGFDEPRLDTLFLAMPIAWKGTVEQYAGRLHRLHINKKEVQVYDYVDVHVGMLERMYHKRLKGYAAIGYTIKSDGVTFESASSIFNTSNFFSVFFRDVNVVKKEIIIVSPFLRNRRLSQMLSLLKEAMHRGVEVTIVTRPASDFVGKNKKTHQEMLEMVENSVTFLRLKPKIHQKFAVMDQRIAWYGSMNLLSFGYSEESMMRLDSAKIAHELLEVI